MGSTDTILGGKPAYHHKIVGWTTGLLDKLWPVYDVYRSYAYRGTDLPYKAIRDVKEQKYTDYKEDIYDRKSRADSALVRRETDEQVVVPMETRDMVSVAYYLRNQLNQKTPKKGDRIELPTFFNGEFFPLVIQYEGTEVIKSKFGRIKCYRFVPLVKAGDIFETQDALTVWLSADQNHIPVRVRFKLFLGSMYCDLVRFSGLKWPLQMVIK